MKASLNPNLKDFWMTRSRNKVLYGGRGSSKSWDASGHATRLAYKYRLRFLCVRQIQNKIEESVYTLLKTQIDRFSLNDEFRILDNKIISKAGSEFVFYGLWRHIDEIKSIEGIDVLWIEEAHALTEEQWDILEPTIRKDHSEVWILFNPKLMSDFVYKKFVLNPPPNTVVRKINYEENPFLSDTALAVIKAKKEEDYESYLHVYGGEPKQDDNESVIKRSWIEASIDAHLKLGISENGAGRLGFDVADDGEDKNATARKKGCVVRSLKEWRGQEDELLKSCTTAYNEALLNDCEIVYDTIGVGASSGAKFSELNKEKGQKLRYTKFRANDSVFNPNKPYEKGGKIHNKDVFLNLKAQTWWTVRDMLIHTYNAVVKGMPFDESMIISIDSNIELIEQLKDELSAPRYDTKTRGLIKIESKEDMDKRGIKSPNVADAFIMLYAPTRKGLRIS